MYMSLISYMLSIDPVDYIRLANHWHRNKFKNRAEAIRDLIRTSLDVSEASFAVASPEAAVREASVVAELKKLNGTSPWGIIQSAEQVIPGIIRVTTALHGGLHVGEGLLKTMPDCMRHQETGWFEEDSEWAFVFAVFEKDIQDGGSERDVKVLDRGTHLKILAQEWPEEYAEWRSLHAA